MSTTLAITSFKASVGWDLESTNSFGTNTSNVASFAYSATLANGSGNGKAQVLYAATLTIASGATTTLDLNATSGTPVKDPLGNNVVLVKAKGIFIQHATDAASGTLEVAGSWFASTVLTGTTPKLIMYPSQVLLLGGSPAGASSDYGWTVTDSTGDTLTLKNNDAASVTVNVVVFGE